MIIEINSQLIDSSQSSLAIKVKNVNYSYNSVVALKDVNMGIPTGVIYGLLGPSGCGKTSLLRCIVGRLTPQSGTIKIFGLAPNSKNSIIPGPGIGYMPQELALYLEFTVSETLNYFGLINGLAKDEIKSRSEFLIEFLALNDCNRMIKCLSGGQKRRVSLAVALIHKPPLLILDEPTVGVDPLLRQSIWAYLLKITQNEETTVVITTHYVEEARQANIVGMMRHGSLLVEESPNMLLQKNNVTSLEMVFIKVCQKSNNEESKFLEKQDDTNSDPDIDNIDPKWALIIEEKNRSFESWHNKVQTLNALMFKNTIRLKRNIPLLLFQLAVPTIQILLFCICIGQDPKGLRVSVYKDDYGNKYSDYFIDNLNKDVIIVYSETPEEAIQKVVNGYTWAALIFPQNYSNYLDQRLTVDFLLNFKNSTLDKSTLYFYVDTTEFPIELALISHMLEAFKIILPKAFEMNEDIQLFEPLVSNPFFKTVDPPVYGDLKPSYRDFLAPGLILSVTYILALGLTALSFVTERKEGLLERSLICGVANIQILLAHIIIQIVVIIIQSLLLLATIFGAFNITLKGDMFLVILLTILQGIAGMSFGFLISALSYDEKTALTLAIACFYPNISCSGIFWPIEATPDFARYLSIIFPQTLPVKSMRCILSRSWDFSYYPVWIGFVSTIAWSLIFNFFALIIFASKK